MKRETGAYESISFGEETARAFIPHPLPPSTPALQMNARRNALLAEALSSISRLAVAETMVPSHDWFLYGYTRKEALISSQIEGTQATFQDVAKFEATREGENPADIEEVCNYVDALNYARAEMASPKGLPISTRLLCGIHLRLMRGVRGAEKQPGHLRNRQNWIGGAKPGSAIFVPPPHTAVPAALAKLERWIHATDPLPALVRAGLAHAQFETIHPFLDGNGRAGRLLITLLVEHWGLLKSPLLYLSLAFKRHQPEYYRRLSQIRTAGDWEGWTEFFLACVREAADDGVDSATRIFALIDADRRRLIRNARTTVAGVRLHDLLIQNPMLTLARTTRLLKTTKPTAIKAIASLQKCGILHEISGRRRDRIYSYRAYLAILEKDTLLEN